MSDLVSYQLDDGIATLTLNNGKVNAISPDVIAAFNAALDQSEKDRAVVIVTGQPGILSGGYDLKVMTSSPEAASSLVTQGSTLARRMLSHPFPIIVACPGHAIAKGAFLLLSADYRIGVEGPFNIGLNEVQIGMTMHHAGIELARDRLRKSAFNRSVINAEIFNPEGAMQAGFLDQVVSVEALSETARTVATQLKKINMNAHGKTKLKTRKAFLDTLDAAIELDKKSFI
ncbi:MULTISPECIES: crotonase/enoyl-CoA hydratase family protein [Pseudomonas syringae group]|uniref:crotonase/enoyl-CoA hydratase family protein n=1 Tax=Pseudomonas syringae group TaxID=136849 RepID=UPI000F020EF6|nr:crotonase/enoyl-CoA hydratase family protein [Pseudomonas viridiflava]MBD8807755.1 crotonase/enoyl-CoA hydratase family protein [Pseudomonas syringae]MEE4080017.1 crotonase/enoyl-CoA hydratase family protein [Pseudomonas viridiflava]MEE4097422.1 crotonase/enoyl-CoA hydratase family protein [Pseudomonas viridiflava]MEE4124577.1 crotonase/enoyl-CoA hydratase family protein [Pseudomonas viridiflava]MEE4180481.1 crotonase/enoyl-CoA hydratase family protein [Pseudomonas viridiflava]